MLYRKVEQILTICHIQERQLLLSSFPGVFCMSIELSLFKKGKIGIIAKFHRTDLVI